MNKAIEGQTLYDTKNRFVKWIEHNFPVDDCVSLNTKDETDVVAAQRLRSYANDGDYPHNLHLRIDSPLQQKIRALYLTSTGAQIDCRKIASLKSRYGGPINLNLQEEQNINQEEQNIKLEAEECLKAIGVMCRAIEDECAKSINSAPELRVLNTKLVELSERYNLLLLRLYPSERQ